MSKRFRLTEDAVLDLEEAVAYISEESERAAQRLADDFENAFVFLTEWPGSGHSRLDLTPDNTLRFWTIAGYLIAYQIVSDHLVVIAVLHGSRDVETILSKRLEH